MYKQKEGMCGVAMCASYPIKEHPNHPVPETCGYFGWTTCEAGSECVCNVPFLFDLFCWEFGCQEQVQPGAAVLHY